MEEQRQGLKPDKFLVVISTPRHQGLLGAVPEKHEVKTIEANDVEHARTQVSVPTGGYLRICPMTEVRTFRSVTDLREVTE